MAHETTGPTKSSKKLVLVDAYSLLFRAFFAGRYLSTSDNRPTGALFGFTNMLLSILSNTKPDAIIVCWDAPGKTHRDHEFAAYKAQRPEVDPQLRAQMPEARRIVEAFGVQSAELEGYEADDLIGTYAARGDREGYSVIILTGDSDQLQLVGDAVSVHMTQRGVSEVKQYDAEAVRERYGVGPDRIADWKALVGDTSDNIPGVPGIGEKTATALLQQWDTLDNILEHVDEVTPSKASSAIAANVEQARQSRRLATIVCDVPLDDPILSYAPSAADWQRAREIFTEFEFKSLLTRIPGPATFSPEPGAQRDDAEATPFHAKVTYVDDAQKLGEALRAVKSSNAVAIALDAVGDRPMLAELKGVAFATSIDDACYLPVRLSVGGGGSLEAGLFGSDESESNPEFAAGVSDLSTLVENPKLRKIGHNTKFAEILLERAGLHPTAFQFDSLIAAYLLNAGRASYPLQDIAEAHLEVRFEPDDNQSPQNSLALETALLFSLDAPLQAALANVGMTRIFEDVEMPLVPVLARIEQAGLLVDNAYLGTLSNRMATEIAAAAKEIYALAGEEFNIGSVKQLQVVLFEKLQLPTGKKTKTGFTTGADLLEQLAPEYPIARKIIEYREIAKLKATYADALPKLINPRTGRVHTSLHQTVASTGRLSSSDPNVQNIPIRSELGREIRRAFVAPARKVLLSCDYSQIELRVLAHITGDPALTEAFTKDEDVHAATASRVFEVPLSEVTRDQRSRAKTINFAVIYGQSAFTLATTLGVETSVASAWIKDYFERLPGVQKYVKDTTALAHKQKYVSTLLGRRRYLPEIDSGNHGMRQFAERAAVNMPIQGTAADIMKLAMIHVDRYLQDECPHDCKLVLQVHDELLFEVDESDISVIVQKVRALMEEAFTMSVPLRVDANVGANWSEMNTV